MSIYSLKNKILKEEEDWSDEIDAEIEFNNNGDIIIRTGEDMIWNNINLLLSESSSYPDIKFSYIKNQPMKINIIPLNPNDIKMKHGARIKIKRPYGNKDDIIATKSLNFNKDDKGNTIINASDYRNQNKKSGSFNNSKSNLSNSMVDATFSFISMNPNAIEGFINGTIDFDYIRYNYIPNYNKLDDKEKKRLSKEINIIK